MESRGGTRQRFDAFTVWNYFAGDRCGQLAERLRLLYVAIADASTNSDNLLGVLSGTGIQPNGSRSGIYCDLSQCFELAGFLRAAMFLRHEARGRSGDCRRKRFLPGARRNRSWRQCIWTFFDLPLAGRREYMGRRERGWQRQRNFDPCGCSRSELRGRSLAAQVLAMFAGNDGGVWASQDVFNAATAPGTQLWADLNTNTGNANTSLNLTQFYPGISIHPATDQIIYGGTQGNDMQQFSGTLDRERGAGLSLRWRLHGD